MGLLIKPNGPFEVIGDGEQALTLEEVQEAVGGYIESASLRHPIKLNEHIYNRMYCNEDGLAQGLPMNKFGTYFAGMEIVGNVLLTFMDLEGNDY